MTADPEYLKWARERAAEARVFFLDRVEAECTPMFGAAPYSRLTLRARGSAGAVRQAVLQF